LSPLAVRLSAMVEGGPRHEISPETDRRISVY
jgi:hypothetical protein